MAAKLTRLTHKIAMQTHLVAEGCTICSSRSRRPVRKLLDTPSYGWPRTRIISRNFHNTSNLKYRKVWSVSYKRRRKRSAVKTADIATTHSWYKPRVENLHGWWITEKTAAIWVQHNFMWSNTTWVSGHKGTDNVLWKQRGRSPEIKSVVWLIEYEFHWSTRPCAQLLGDWLILQLDGLGCKPKCFM
jgi:hypothetical protein